MFLIIILSEWSLEIVDSMVSFRVNLWREIVGIMYIYLQFCSFVLSSEQQLYLVFVKVPLIAVTS